MTRSFCILTILAVAALAPARAGAQQPEAELAAEPRITTMLSSAERVYAVLDFVMRQTPAQDQKQTQVIKDHLDLFLIGIDRTQPIRMDLLSAGNGYRYRPSLPVVERELENFRANNLQPLDIVTRRRAATLYECVGTVFQGWMRYRHDYASFGELQQDVPIDLPDPRLDLRPLLQRGHDAAFELQNAQQGARDVALRHELFVRPAGVRQDLLDRMPRREGETADDLAIRQRLWEIQLDELQRLYAEAAHATFAWNTELDEAQARIHVDVVPIAETALAESVGSIGVRPSRFADLERRPEAVFSGRYNHPLDALRQQNLLDLWELLRTHEKSQMDADADLAEEHKANSRRAIDLIFDLLAAGTRAGLADLGAEVYPAANGGFTAVGGFVAADGTAVTEILQLLPETGQGREVEMEVDREGDVAIHLLRFSTERHPELNDFFAGNQVYVGASEDAVWLAAGPNALADLKQAIARAVAPDSEPRPDDPFATLFMRMRPWADLRERTAPPDDELARYRRLAVEAFTEGDDVVEMRLDRVENDVRGTLVAHRGIFRFIGRAMAEFSRENLQ